MINTTPTKKIVLHEMTNGDNISDPITAQRPCYSEYGFWGNDTLGRVVVPAGVGRDPDPTFTKKRKTDPNLAVKKNRIRIRP